MPKSKTQPKQEPKRIPTPWLVAAVVVAVALGVGLYGVRDGWFASADEEYGPNFPEQAAPQRGVIDRVVVHQRREVDQLDHRREGQRVLRLLAAHAAREEEERRPEELAAHEEQVLVDLLDVREVGEHDAADLVAHTIEHVAHRSLDGGKLGRQTPERSSQGDLDVSAARGAAR